MNRQRAIDILHLPAQWTRKDVRKAYKQRAIEIHPDKHPTRKDMATQFIELKEAHDYLLQVSENADTEPTTQTRNPTYTQTLLEELITQLTETYRDALPAFILSLPPEKQRWCIEFLDIYGELLLGKEVYSILAKVRAETKEEEEVIPTSMYSIHNEVYDGTSTKSTTTIIPPYQYHVYFDEMMTDQIIVHTKEETTHFIPSWCTEWETHSIHRHLPKYITVDASNHILFHCRLSFHTLYTSSGSSHATRLVPLNASYFSQSSMIHVLGSVPRNKIQITRDPQYIPEAVITSICVYDANGSIRMQKDGEGMFLPSEPIHSPQRRASCTWCIHLIP